MSFQNGKFALEKAWNCDNTDFDQNDVLCFTSTAQHSSTSERSPFDQTFFSTWKFYCASSETELESLLKVDAPETLD